MDACQDKTGLLNNEVELTVQATAAVSALFPKNGVLMLGDAGVEFIDRAGRALAQLSWDALSVVRVDVYGSFVRSVELHMADGGVLSLVVSDGADVVRCMHRHLERAKLVPAKKQLGKLFRGKKER